MKHRDLLIQGHLRDKLVRALIRGKRRIHPRARSQQRPGDRVKHRYQRAKCQEQNQATTYESGTTKQKDSVHMTSLPVASIHMNTL